MNTSSDGDEKLHLESCDSKTLWFTVSNTFLRSETTANCASFVKLNFNFPNLNSNSLGLFNLDQPRHRIAT